MSRVPTSAGLMRSLVSDALEKGLYSTAVSVVESLMLLGGSNTADAVLLSKCYKRNREPRRALAVLEHRGFLSSRSIEELCRMLDMDQLASLSEAQANLCTHLDALLLAAECLLEIEQHEDCVSLLQPLVILDANKGGALEQRTLLAKRCFSAQDPAKINPVAAIYCIAGKCFDALENRARAVKSLTVSLKIDLACIEAASYLVENCMLSQHDRAELATQLCQTCNQDRNWAAPLVEAILFDDVAIFQQNVLRREQTCLTMTEGASGLVHKSKYALKVQNFHDAYRFSRHAYTIDPYDERGLMVYIASMTELGLKTELFYLGHELAHSYPKSQLSWYCVGCYYWCCRKYDLAQKYLYKTTKIHKRFSAAWVLLGHVLSVQEEGEQAIAAYRTAARLLPGDHKPLVYMAKELIRTNFVPLAQHMLQSALQICPNDAGLLNELGVVHLKLNQMDLAIAYLELAVQRLSEQRQAAKDSNAESTYPQFNGESRLASVSSANISFRKTCGFEVFCNYATALRKCGRFDDALYWYDKCLATNPKDAQTHASIGFTYHLMQRFDLAINSYHQALALQPKLGFCSDMLTRAMEDISSYSITCPASLNNQPSVAAHNAPAAASIGTATAIQSNLKTAVDSPADIVSTMNIDEQSVEDGNIFNSFESSGMISEQVSFSRIAGRLSLGSEDGHQLNSRSAHSQQDM